MIEIGKYNDLKVLRESGDGLVLGDGMGTEVYLPQKHCPERVTASLNVFVYQDNEGKKVATTETPKILVDEFALLQVVDVTDFGAFLDWGMEKDLLVPLKEQQSDMLKGRWYIVFMDVDQETGKLYASSRLDSLLQNFVINVEEGEEVDLMVMRESGLGYEVIVNNEHKGLVYKNEVFKDLNVGERLRGYVKTIREDKKLDISIQPLGYRNFIDANTELVYTKLQENQGFLPITDKSSPDEIYALFGISKKAFKKAIGALYKDRKIELHPDGIKLV
ncbi:S1-like domain-containing RNA-binding protein [Flammeovirgaceae bacterium SG7u.111]|nr:S1-like domain-containing RNA-binding protein [Flammeovirgaceae bacterium SG7u.132]WPO36733.1 S1-like domain-containing RNA-binding protein [Flammeovirgaceae bacterium SG7u.111]